MPKVGSVEEFQGQERDIILISTVRSSVNLVKSDLRHSLGFVQSSKRMNVSISRARYLMVIFGNPNLLGLDQCWRSYIKYYYQTYKKNTKEYYGGKIDASCSSSSSNNSSGSHHHHNPRTNTRRPSVTCTLRCSTRDGNGWRVGARRRQQPVDGG